VQTGNRDKHQDADEHLADCHQPSAVSRHEGFRSRPHRMVLVGFPQARSCPHASIRELVVWQKAHHLTLRLYSVTETFPREEQYGCHPRPVAVLHPFVRISLKDAVAARLAILHASFKSRLDLRAS